jgi:hypothetical protein
MQWCPRHRSGSSVWLTPQSKPASTTSSIFSVLLLCVAMPVVALPPPSCAARTPLPVPFEYAFEAQPAVINGTQIINGTQMLEFTSTDLPLGKWPLQPGFFLDYFGAVKKLELFVRKSHVHESSKVPPHLVIHGFIKTGKSTLLNRVFPAVVRQTVPDALFLRIETFQVCMKALVNMPGNCTRDFDDTSAFLEYLLSSTQNVLWPCACSTILHCRVLNK